MLEAKDNNQLKPLMGIGACMAGQAVRYNGQTKSANEHVKALGEYFDLRPFCPEMGIGMGVPRAPIHLVGSAIDVRALDVASHSEDFTEPLRDYAKTVLSLAPNLCGYILVKGSPSCGYDRVKRFADNGHSVASDQQGVFAKSLATLDPLLPLEDDGRLHDAGLRESFTTRAFTYHAWQQLVAAGLTAHTLVTFYSSYKYLVMAHHMSSYKTIGPMLANAGKADIQKLGDEFIHALMHALSHTTTRASHSNVLFHLAGYLKRTVSGTERQRLRLLIEQYQQGIVPLIVPITLLKHHFQNNPNAYIDKQVFMSPYPDELQLRNTL